MYDHVGHNLLTVMTSFINLQDNLAQPAAPVPGATSQCPTITRNLRLQYALQFLNHMIKY
jgi:hypothetical protein